MIGNRLKRLEVAAMQARLTRCRDCGDGTHPFVTIRRGPRGTELEPFDDLPSPYDDSGRCRRCGHQAKSPVTLVRPAPRQEQAVTA
jgi:hypothetical protein